MKALLVTRNYTTNFYHKTLIFTFIETDIIIEAQATEVGVTGAAVSAGFDIVLEDN